jgi:outer membrane protein
MMKRIFAGPVFLIMLLVFSMPALSADLKIGYVDLQRALNESESGRKAKAELEQMIKEKQKVIDAKGKEVESLKAELEKKGTVLSKDALKTKQDELDRKMREYKRLVQDSQEEVKKKENELTFELIKEIRKIVEKIGKDEKFTFIFENIEEFLLYKDKSVDITDRVIEQVNKTMKEKK